MSSGVRNDKRFILFLNVRRMLFICTENTNSVPADETIVCKVNEGCFRFDSLLFSRTVNVFKSSDGKRGNSCETCSSATQIDLLSIPNAGMTQKSRAHEGVG